MAAEGDRLALQRRLEDVLGRREAEALMTTLPPIPWTDLATKQDLRALEGRLTGRLDRLEERFDGLEQRFDGLERRFDGLEQGTGRALLAFGHKLELMEQTFLATLHETISANLVAGNRSTVLAVVGSVLGSTTLSILATQIP